MRGIMRGPAGEAFGLDFGFSLAPENIQLIKIIKMKSMEVI